MDVFRQDGGGDGLMCLGRERGWVCFWGDGCFCVCVCFFFVFF